MSISKQQAKDKLKDALELRDMGALNETEFNEIKNECLVAMGLRSEHSLSSIALPSLTRLDPQPLIALVQEYASQKTGSWSSQSKERLLGYLLDFRRPDIKVHHLEQFITVSYTYKLLSHLEHQNKSFVQQEVSTLSELYNVDFIRYCISVWSEVLGLSPMFVRAMEPEPSAARKPEMPVQQQSGVNSLFDGKGHQEMVYVPSGTFMMGALPGDSDAGDYEKPRHKVTISQGFWLGKYVVTQDLYELVMETNPSYFKGGNRPVECVSWCDAVLFCNKLSALEGLIPAYDLPNSFQNDDGWSTKVRLRDGVNGYRLPTEAEWEYAARGREYHKYSGSNNIDDVAWYGGYGGGGTVKDEQTQPVGQLQCNGFGLYDMSGNVWEWVWDSDYREYKSSAVTDPVFVDLPSPKRVLRGGSWGDLAWVNCVSWRNWDFASNAGGNMGFRILRP